MPFNEQPPRPPENHTILFTLAVLAYLAAYQQNKKEADVLAIAPVDASGKKTPGTNINMDKKTIYPTKEDVTVMYSCLKSILLRDEIESSDIDLPTRIRQKLLHEKRKQSIRGLDMLGELVSYPPKDLFTVFVKKAEKITDESFSKKFDYTTIVRGANDEVLTLTHEADESQKKKVSLYLGMTVRYRKKLGPPTGKHPLAGVKHVQSPGTGPLEGEGKIIRISIPKIGHVPDQAITLLVKDGKVTTETFLAIDELILE